MRLRSALLILAVLLTVPSQAETLAELGARLGRDTSEAYARSPYTAISSNYFNRFSRDPNTKLGEDEILLDGTWTIGIDAKDAAFAETMAGHLSEFLNGRMGADVKLGAAGDKQIVLSDRGAADMKPESFTIDVAKDKVTVRGADAEGMRDGVVKLVPPIWHAASARTGARCTDLHPATRAPRRDALRRYGPRLDVHGLQRKSSQVAVSCTGFLPVMRFPNSRLGVNQARSKALRRLLQTPRITNSKPTHSFPCAKNFPERSHLPTRPQHPRHAHLESRRRVCAMHRTPGDKQFLSETMKQMFQAAPELDGVVLIIGGEGFYHCFMRPFGVEKGHTNCTHCEALGADTVVANLCNLLADAARSVNPKAEVIAWPYSAEHVWSSDKAQSGFIAKLKPGTGIFTEMEKDEYVEKPDGVRKHLWDYSIEFRSAPANERNNRSKRAAKQAFRYT